jgi:hypothetical protein
VDITDLRYLIHRVHHIPLITGDSGCPPVTFVGPGIKLPTTQYGMFSPMSDLHDF